jgi:hypothetical protein
MQYTCRYKRADQKDKDKAVVGCYGAPLWTKPERLIPAGIAVLVWQAKYGRLNRTKVFLGL